MALLDRTVALEDLLKGLGGEPSVGADRVETPSGSVRSQPAQASVARTAQRPLRGRVTPTAERSECSLARDTPAKATSPPVNEGQLREMKRAMETTAQDSNRSRMTPEALKEERIGMLRQKIQRWARQSTSWISSSSTDGTSLPTTWDNG